jgi:hypothetical protein
MPVADSEAAASEFIMAANSSAFASISWVLFGRTVVSCGDAAGALEGLEEIALLI